MVRAPRRAGGVFGQRITCAILCVAVAVLLFGPQAAAAPDSAAPAVHALGEDASEDFTRSDGTAALAAARELQHRVEDVSQRTETSLTFANPDGTWTSEIASGPERVRDDAGQWHGLDTDLVPDGGSFRPRFATTDLSISAGGDRTFASMTEGGKDLAWRWPSVLPTPVVDGPTATYGDVVPDGDLVVTATASGFTHSVVLHSAPEQPLDITVPIATDGAELAEGPGSSISIATDAGETLVSAPAPVMYDSAEGSGSEPTVVPVDTSIAQPASGAATLTLSPDESFLEDPATQYPVTIDPTFTTYATDDTYVQKAGGVNQASLGQVRVGTADGGTNVSRAFLHFGESLADKKVLSASLTMRNFLSNSCTAGAVRVQAINQSWSATSITWANQPTVDSAPYADVTAARGAVGCPAADATWDVTPTVQAWADGGPNHGLRLAAVDETDNNSFRGYRSTDYTAQGDSQRPHLSITYDPRASVPTNVQVSPCTGGCSAPYTVTGSRPLLTAQATDPDSAPITYHYQVRAAGSTALLVDGSSDAMPSGAEGSYRVPQGALSVGQSYEFRVGAADAHGTSWTTWYQMATVAGAYSSPTPITSPQTIAADTTWDAQHSPYVLNADVTVAYGSTLTLAPGTVIKVNKMVNVYGRLVANGTKAEPITVTSVKDDSVDGDYNGDGSATLPAPGDYAAAFQFLNPPGAADVSRDLALVRPTSTLRNVSFRYGGYDIGTASSPCGGQGAVVTQDLSRVLVEHSEFVEMKCGGFNVGYQDPDIASVVVRASYFLPTVGGSAVIRPFGGTFVDNYFSDTAHPSVATWLAGNDQQIRTHYVRNWIMGPVSLTVGGNSCAESVTRQQFDFEQNVIAGRWTETKCSFTHVLVHNDLSGNYWPSLEVPIGSPGCWDPGLSSHNPEWAQGGDLYCYGRPAHHGAYFTKIEPIMAAPPPWANPGLESNPASPPQLDAEQLLGTGSGEFAVDPTGTQADPVNTANGSYLDSETDVALPALGLDLDVTRTYNSADTTIGSLGKGWNFNYDQRLTFPDATTVRFKAGDGQGLRFLKTSDGYTGASGVTAVLSQPDANTYQITTREGLKYVFDAAGHLTALVDQHGNQITFGYDTTGHLATAANSGRSLTFTYTGDRLTQVTQPDGYTVQYGYTGTTLTSVTDQAGKTTTYTYDDPQDRLTKTTDPLSRTVMRLGYDPTTGRVSDQWDGAGEHTLFTWNAATQTATMTDPRGNDWVDVYDGSALVTRTDPLGRTWSYTRDGHLQLVRVEDPAGNITTLDYNTAGDLTTYTGPRGTTSTSFDAQHHPTRSVNARGYPITMEYNAAGDLTRVERPGTATQAGPVQTMTYDPSGQLLTSTDAGKTTTFTYDPTGDLKTVTTPTGQVTSYEYSATGCGTGRLTATIAPGNARTEYCYDPVGRPTTLKNPLGRIVDTNTYNDAGQLATSTDFKNRVTSYSYHPDGRLWTITNPDPAAAPYTYTYDANGNTATETDWAGHTSTYTYNSVNEVTGTNGPQGQWSFDHTALGTLSSVTGPDGLTTTMSYNPAGSLTKIDYPGTTHDVSYGYDPSGNRKSMTDGAGQVTYTYDQLDQLQSVQRGSTTFGYGYDPQGHLAHLTYPSGTAVDYAYDDDGRMTSVKRNQATIAAYTWTNRAQPATATIGTGTGQFTRTYTYDADDRLTRLQEVMSGGQVLLDDTYGRDGTDNPTKITHADASSDAYTYDTLDRLTKACYQTTSCTGATDYVRWTYNPVGGRTSEVRPTGTTSYTRDGTTGRITKITPPGSAAINYTYDLRGQLKQVGADTYDYDAAGRTTNETVAGTSTNYTYDGDGRRLTAATTTQTTNFTWEPNSYELIAETDAAGASVREYLHGVDAIASISPSGGFSYLHPDLQGSIRNVTDTTGQVLESRTYEPFGVVRASTPASPSQPLGFAGQYADPSGHTHLRARQYDPTTGTFTTPDVMAGAGTGGNYTYANNNPMTQADPLGLWPSLSGAWHAISQAAPIISAIATPLSFTPLAPIAAPIAIAADFITAASALYNTYQACSTPKGACGQSILASGASIGLTFLGGGALAKSVVRKAARACSFTGSTVVLMADGTKKPIEDIEVGDKVMATDPATGEQVAKAVEHLWIHEDTVVDLIVDGEVITTTEDHPFWSVTDQQFERADELSPGEKVWGADGRVIVVSGLEFGTARAAVAYNLSIEGIHTYHVGDAEILVHNDCGPLLTRQFDEVGRRITNASPAVRRQTDELADYLGYRPTGRTDRHGQMIYKSGKRYIAQDATSHNGGFWKMASSPKELQSKRTRSGSYDFLLQRVGR